MNEQLKKDSVLLRKSSFWNFLWRMRERMGERASTSTPPPPCALYFRGLIVSSCEPATCKVTFSFFRMTHLWETNDHHHLPIQRPSRPQAYSVNIPLQRWQEDFWQLFLKLDISASWESFTIFALSSKRSKNVVCNCNTPLELICSLHSCNFI